MGRKSMKLENKKSKISITLAIEINDQLEELKVNKSKLINWLLNKYFNSIKIIANSPANSENK